MAAQLAAHGIAATVATTPAKSWDVDVFNALAEDDDFPSECARCEKPFEISALVITVPDEHEFCTRCAVPDYEARVRSNTWSSSVRR